MQGDGHCPILLSSGERRVYARTGHAQDAAYFWANESAGAITSSTPLSMTREWPRPGISMISVGLAGFLRCFLYDALAIAHGTVLSLSPEMNSIGPRSGFLRLTLSSLMGLKLAKAAWFSGS